MATPHIIAVPYPAQGHVIPMLEITQWLVKQGIKVTFVNTNFNHQRVIDSLSDSDNIRQLLNMVSMSDGVEPWEDRNDLGKLTQAISKTMPGQLEALIDEINGKGGEKITCVVADWSMKWALEVAEKLGLKRAAFSALSAAILALSVNIPKLVSDGIIDSNGRPLTNQSIRLSPNMPLMNPMTFMWVTAGEEATQKTVFDILQKNSSLVKFSERIICNSSYYLEPGVFSLLPDILPVGPILASNRLGKAAGNFWQEDSDCLAWLDQQPVDSVIYVAFGSFTFFDHTQFEELALGLELTNRPFLWVVRHDVKDGNTGSKHYPEGFADRVKNRGRMVGWAPQQEVLSHASVACFISHCGWNSTVEGIGNGVPLLCWPFYADQFLNQTYICDEWEVGLGLSKDGSGIIRRGEIRDKVELILSDKNYKERATSLQAKTVDSVRGGISDFNHERIVKALSHTENINELINLASIPDGLAPNEDRNDLGKLTDAMMTVMPEKLEALIESTNATESDKIICVITDYGLGWALDLANKLGIKRAAFVPASVGLLALAINVLKLVDEGIIDSNGTPVKQQVIQLSPDMPAMSTLGFAWMCIGDFTAQKIIFNSILKNIELAKLADWVICNSSHELERGALAVVPNCVPVGPLLASNRLGKSAGYFWPEDSASLAWLDQQPPNSTIYIAFGSFTVFDQTQFQELAMGLELTQRPFLWVVRQDMTLDNDKAYPKGFKERVKNRGKVVNWAPQQKVLSHPSVACFLSHCGWNSTVEGISNGLPFLCWPYFADQFLNQSYICEYWKIGLSLDKDENEIIVHEEIRKKVELLLTDKSYKDRASNLQSKAVSSVTKGGCSQKNFNNFVAWIKET
ncbi:hypothetical protein ACP275_08G030200 [Erythranthe tilingii]